MQTLCSHKTLTRSLRLASIPKLGFYSLQRFCQKVEIDLLRLADADSQMLLTNGWQASQIAVLKGQCRQTEAKIKKAIQWSLASSSNEIISFFDSHYPDYLRHTDTPPIVLFVKGNLALLSKPKLAFVGTRAPTQYATDAIEQLVTELKGVENICTISGMALGVDASCHRASIANDIPTIGVLGCGIDVVYPKRHNKLFSDVAKQGLLISEFFPGTQPLAFNFPRRNRLISALSEGVVITEGKIKSGTMVTVKHAIEQNKEVLVVPCSMFNPNGELGQHLLNEGALPVRSGEDIVDAIDKFIFNPNYCKNVEKTELQDLATDPLLDSVSESAASVDEIAKRSGMSLIDVLTKLLEYELRGLVASTTEGYVKLRG